MAFFLPVGTKGKAGKRGRAKTKTEQNVEGEKKRKQHKEEDEEIVSEESGSEIEGKKQIKKAQIDSDEEDEKRFLEQETVEEKRERLAKGYIQSLRKSKHDSDEEELQEDEEKEEISKQLMEEARTRSGHHIDQLADRIATKFLEVHEEEEEEDEDETKEKIRSEEDKTNSKRGKKVGTISSGDIWRGHKLSPTCIDIDATQTKLFSGAKDGSIILWDVEAHKKITVAPTSHRKPGAVSTSVLAIAVSQSQHHLVASGGNDGTLRLWDTRQQGEAAKLKNLTGHKSSITGIAFQTDDSVFNQKLTGDIGGSSQLYTCSADRTVKVWNLELGVLVDTLYGHENEVWGIDSCGLTESAVTVGGDRTVRKWQIAKGEHLVLRSGGASADCLRSLSADSIVSGHRDGSVMLWKTSFKRPVFTFNRAHGPSTPPIISIGGGHNVNVMATGSSEGGLRLWKIHCENDQRAHAPANPNRIAPLIGISRPGVINGIAMAKNGRFVACAVGQEHRLGRWIKDTSTKNGISITPLLGATED